MRSSAGESWSMNKLDSNPARINGPLGATYSYGRKKLSTGSEIAAAPTADGSLATMDPTMDPTEPRACAEMVVRASGAWSRLSNELFPRGTRQ